MVAWMNAEALEQTVATGFAHYYSRSRKKLWKKGETSGNLQNVIELRTDCDQDALWLKVKVAGHDATCHTGRRSCFYRTFDSVSQQWVVNSEPLFDPAKVYGDHPKTRS